MDYWNKICGFATIFFLSAFATHAQIAAINRPATMIVYKKQLLPNDSIVLAAKSPAVNRKPFFAATIAQDYYTKNIGWICKKEFALEKITKIPLRVRLGSLQQCNYLEGKR